jgi:hypothetical protein
MSITRIQMVALAIIVGATAGAIGTRLFHRHRIAFDPPRDITHGPRINYVDHYELWRIAPEYQLVARLDPKQDETYIADGCFVIFTIDVLHQRSGPSMLVCTPDYQEPPDAGGRVLELSRALGEDAR